MSRPSDPSRPEKPSYEVDFPGERAEAEQVSRREFAKVLCVVSGGFALGNGWVAVKDTIAPRHRIVNEVRVCQTAAVAIGGTHQFTIPGSAVPYILIRLAQGEWRCFEQKCTHLSCAVYYAPTSGTIECPCHRGYFDARTGEVLKGPPPRPLPGLAVVVRDEEVFVSEHALPTSPAAGSLDHE